MNFDSVECGRRDAFPAQGQHGEEFVLPRASAALEERPPAESGCDPDRCGQTACSHGGVLKTVRCCQRGSMRTALGRPRGT